MRKLRHSKTQSLAQRLIGGSLEEPGFQPQQPGSRGQEEGRVCSDPKKEASLEEELTSSRYSPEIPAPRPPRQGLPGNEGKELGRGKTLPIFGSFISETA